ncbi:MAG TPA: chemotaxis protein CheW [bacterium]|jgi:chemotaxis signal transduction protein|nr:chemotaxis protein CheW [bacterium]
MENLLSAVVFLLDGHPYAIEALKVREIVGGANFEPLSIEGEVERFIQIRGKAAKVVDLRGRLGIPSAAKEGLNSFVAVQISGTERNRLAALWVDSLLDLIHVPMDQLKPLPLSFRPIRPKYIKAVIEGEMEPVCVLNLDEILKDGVGGEGEIALGNKAS